MAALVLVVGGDNPLADDVLLLTGDRCCERAADLYERGIAKRVWVPHWKPGRLAEYEIVPPPVELVRGWLEREGIPVDRIQVLGGEAASKSELAAEIARWLSSHPDDELTVLCDAFSSRRWQWRLREQGADRVVIRPLDHRNFDSTNWFQSKHGVLAAAGSFLDLAYAVFGSDEVWRECDPESLDGLIPQTSRK